MEIASQSNKKTILLSRTRGAIYDRNRKAIVNLREKYFAAVIPTPNALMQLQGSLSAIEISSIRKRLSDGYPVVVPVGNYQDSFKDIRYLKTVSRYFDEQSAVHLIGYLDNTGESGISGIEKSFDSTLKESAGKLSVTFTVDGTGRVLSGDGILVNDDNYNSKAGVALTIDKQIQESAEKALNDFNITTGAVVVLKVNTSEILAMASAPVFNPNNITSSLSDTNSPLINRVLTPYAVGSIFKPIVAAAALESGISEETQYECSGQVSVGGNVFRCHKRSGHGIMNMAQATANSCNAYYINLSHQVGAEPILELALELGMGTKAKLAEDYFSQAGNLPSVSEIDSKAALANLSFGQGSLLATPLQIAAVYACFANDGIYRQPYVLKELIDAYGESYAYFEPAAGNRVITKKTAEKIREFLSLTVEEGSGELAKPMLSSAAGKTATAQSGQFENGKELFVTWFAGFFPVENPQYVVVIMKEKGSTSTTDCAPVFRQIADSILSFERDLTLNLN